MGYRFPSTGDQLENTKKADATRVRSRTEYSTQRRGVHVSSWSSHQSMTRGVTTSAPAASPSHHVTQIGPRSLHCARPPRMSVVAPIVALTAGARIPASAANLKMVLG